MLPEITGWVALAALMSIRKEQMVWLGAEALRRLSSAPLSDQQRFLLGDCVEAYLELDADQRREYDRLMENTSEKGPEGDEQDDLRPRLGTR
jgi:hypothetical protein